MSGREKKKAAWERETQLCRRTWRGLEPGSVSKDRMKGPAIICAVQLRPDEEDGSSVRIRKRKAKQSVQ